jgi:diaminopimelate decarboxylase
MNFIENRLYIGEIPAEEVVKKYGTPLYAYDEETIRFKYKELADCFTYPNIKIYYACKANTNPAIMKILLAEGAGIDAVSPGEVLVALNAGFRPENIMFTATSVTDEELQFCIKKKILVNIDSISELERYGQLNPRSRVSLRINPAVGAGHHDHVITGGPDSKFGIWIGDLEQAVAVAGKYGLQIIGLHQHIGSGILDTKKFLNAMEVLLAAARNFKGLEFIDFGGGIGVPYRPSDNPVSLELFGSMVSSALANFAKNYGKQLSFLFEPGRFLVAESGALLCTVNTIKSTPKHKFVGVDTGFNHLMRPMAYGSYHPIVKINEIEGIPKESVIVAGNVCETGDVFTLEDRELPVIKEGDVLAILVAGAYGYSMASNYNARPKPAEVLVSGKKMSVIRAAEKISELVGK